MFRLIKKLLGVSGIVLTLLISTTPYQPVSAQFVEKNYRSSQISKMAWGLAWAENCQFSGYWTKITSAQRSLLALLKGEDRREYQATVDQGASLVGSDGCSEERIDNILQRVNFYIQSRELRAGQKVMPDRMRNWGISSKEPIVSNEKASQSNDDRSSITQRPKTSISAVGSDLLPSDEKVCGHAINPSDPDRWSKIPEKQSYVKQAQNRGYSSDQCHFMVQGQPASDCPDGSSDNGKGQCSVNRIDSTVPKRPTGTKTEKRPIALHWEGKNQLMLGKIELPVSGANGKVSFNLPDNSGKCSGTFSFKDRSSGVWAAACSTEETLSGSFISTGQGGAITGSGTDSRGNAIKFTIGQR